MSGRPVRSSYARAYSTPTSLEVTLVLGVLTLTAWSLSTMLMRMVGAW